MLHSPSRLWIAIAISTLTIGFSHAAIAQPQLKSPKPQFNNKQRVIVTRRVNQTSVAKVDGGAVTEANLDRSVRRQLGKVRGSRSVNNQLDRPKVNRIDNGMSRFTDPNYNLPRSADIEALNNLIE